MNEQEKNALVKLVEENWSGQELGEVQIDAEGTLFSICFELGEWKWTIGVVFKHGQLYEAVVIVDSSQPSPADRLVVSRHSTGGFFLPIALMSDEWHTGGDIAEICRRELMEMMRLYMARFDEDRFAVYRAARMASFLGHSPKNKLRLVRYIAPELKAHA